MGFFDYVEEPTLVLQKLARDVTGIVLASFPKAGGLLAWQRKVRYRLRGCPLWLYRRDEVVETGRDRDLKRDGGARGAERPATGCAEEQRVWRNPEDVLPMTEPPQCSCRGLIVP